MIVAGVSPSSVAHWFGDAAHWRGSDGIPHRLSNRGSVIAKGKLAPIVGAVSMDLTTIDVTDCPEVRVGDAVSLLGQEGGVSIDARQMARWAGTISYSVLCGISARVKRLYVD